MKRNVCAVLIVIALVVLSGASVWEGSAAVSMEFPESGLYVATNSFPRNTIVDLTNLETGKTVRVIVSAGLDTPGLLALVSREVAEAVGLRSRSIGRIRMIAPSDPIVFSRFPEEHRSGDPDFDPLAAVEDVYGKDPAAAAAIPTVPVPAVTAEPADTEGAAVASDTPLRGDPESAWADVPPMADIPVAAVVPVPEEKESVAAEPDPVPAVTVVPEPVIEAPPALVPEPAIEAPPVLAVVPEPVIEAPPEIAAVPEPVIETPPEIAVVPDPVLPGTAPEPAPPYEYTYTLVPAEERPPNGPPLGSSYGSTPPSPPVFAEVPQIFSVPAVANLERGRYYLQIGAYAHIPTVEQELDKIERNYPLTVQCISLSEKPAYRILIGPVNQGEAGALLRKYMAKGYKDAFVRHAP